MVRRNSRWVLGLIVAASAWSFRADAEDGSRFAASAQRFADTVLAHGRDTYGPQRTPLFVDGLHAESLAPVIWKGPGGVDWVLSNFASHQTLLRLLDGLTAISGDARYREAGEAATRHALEHLRTPSGLLYWGGHAAWDLLGERPVGQGDPPPHELKGHQQYYEILARVNPEATHDLIARIWAGHILDWELLDYNRHATSTGKITPGWEHPFREDITVPFPAKGSNLSFVNVVPPLLHAGTMASVLFDDAGALDWTRRLLLRCQECKDATTGLAGGQLSYREYDRAQEALGHVHPAINEAKIVATYHQTSRYHNLPLAQMQAGMALSKLGGRRAEAGQAFLRWAAEDLAIYARNCWDAEQGVFLAKMTDGTPLDWRKAKTGYYTPESFAPAAPDGAVFWAYALAYRLTGEAALWDMARAIGKQFGLGDLGAPDGAERKLDFGTKNGDFYTVYALLEVHQATEDADILKLAACVGDRLRATQTATGLFPREGREYARTGDDIPLALLHLAAAMSGRRADLPVPAYDRRFFHCVYHGELEPHQQKRADERTMDAYVFYGN